MAVTIILGKCQDRGSQCINEGTEVCWECRISTGNTRLDNLFESIQSRRKHKRQESHEPKPKEDYPVRDLDNYY